MASISRGQFSSWGISTKCIVMPGAPKGNRNAVKHGRNSAATLRMMAEARALIRSTRSTAAKPRASCFHDTQEHAEVIPIEFVGPDVQTMLISCEGNGWAKDAASSPASHR